MKKKARCGQICGQGNSTTVLPNFQRKESGVIAKIKKRLQHFGKSNRFGVPAPKPGAIPNFAKPGYSVGVFSDVVKYVVKGYFRPEKGRSQEEKVIVPQGFPIFGFFDRGWSENHSPIRGAVNCATPGYSLVNPAGAFYQGSHISKLRFTRIIRYEKGKRIQNPAKHGA